MKCSDCKWYRESNNICQIKKCSTNDPYVSFFDQLFCNRFREKKEFTLWQIKKAIEILENEKKCVLTECDRDCGNCESINKSEELVEAFDVALGLLRKAEDDY